MLPWTFKLGTLKKLPSFHELTEKSRWHVWIRDEKSLSVEIKSVSSNYTGHYRCHDGVHTESLYLFINGMEKVKMKIIVSLHLTTIVFYLDTYLAASSQFFRVFTYLEWQEMLLPCRSILYLLRDFFNHLFRPSMPDVSVTYSKMYDNGSDNRTKVWLSQIKD